MIRIPPNYKHLSCLPPCCVSSSIFSPFPVHSERFPVLYLTSTFSLSALGPACSVKTHTGWTHTPHHSLSACACQISVQRLIKALMWCICIFPMEIQNPADTACISVGCKNPFCALVFSTSRCYSSRCISHSTCVPAHAI